VREHDVGVNQICLEPKWPWDHHNRYRPNECNIIPGTPWYIEDSPRPVLTAPGHITTDVGLYAAPVVGYFSSFGAIAFRVAIRKVTGGRARSAWLPVQKIGTPGPVPAPAHEA
jgi:hypothetical protein